MELARRFARDLGARIEWVQGSEEELVDAVKEGQIDKEIDIPSPGVTVSGQESSAGGHDSSLSGSQ